MVAVREITWEEVGAPDFEHPARKVWREALAEIAVKAKATLPECNGRVDSAVKIVLAGDVELLPDGKAQVASQSNGENAYFVVNGSCECKDFPKAPSGWCKHRIAAGLQKRAVALVNAKLDAGTNGQAATPSQPTPATPDAPAGEAQVWRSNITPAPPVPLPEAPASVNVRLDLGGREVQLTLRDSDEGRLLARLDVILQRFPVAVKPADDTPQCPMHGVSMKLNQKDGRTWYSHKTADGWCKGK